MLERSGENFHLPPVDDEAVRRLIISVPDYPEDSPKLEDLLEKYEYFSRVVASAALVETDDLKRDSFVAGIIMTFWLMADSQPRTGGIIPEDDEVDLDGTGGALLTSFRENPLEDHSSFIQLYNEDRQLFAGLALASAKRKEVNWYHFLEGAVHIKRFLNFYLDARELDSQFPPTG